MSFQYLKALHIIFVVTWFAGLFYIVRLFIYHTEAEKKEEPEKSILQTQYKLMEKRLWYGITWPSMIITLIVAIVFLIVLKSNTGLIWGMLGFVVFAVTLLLAIKIYKRGREKAESDGDISKENN